MSKTLADAWSDAADIYDDAHPDVVSALIHAFEATGGCAHDVGTGVLAVVVAWERIRTRKTLKGLPALALPQGRLEAYSCKEDADHAEAIKKRLWLQDIELSAMEGTAPKTEDEQRALIEAEMA